MNITWAAWKFIFLNPINGTRHFEVPLCINTLLKTWVGTVCSCRFNYSCNTFFILHCNKKYIHTLIGVNNISDCYTLFVSLSASHRCCTLLSHRVSRCTLVTLLPVWLKQISNLFVKKQTWKWYDFLLFFIYPVMFSDGCFICFLKANLSSRVDHRIISIWCDIGPSCPTYRMKC